MFCLSYAHTTLKTKQNYYFSVCLQVSLLDLIESLGRRGKKCNLDSVNSRSWVEQEVLYGLNLFVLGNIHAVVLATGARVHPLSSDEYLGSATRSKYYLLKSSLLRACLQSTLLLY